MKPSERLSRIPPYLFAELERKIAAKKAAGVDVISLGIGDPDRPTPAVDRGGDAGGRERARDPPLSLQPRPPRLPRGAQRLLRAALRRRCGRRDRGDPGNRREGGDLQPQPRVPRPGRRGAGERPRLSGVYGRTAAGWRGARGDAARARAGVRAGSRCDPRGDRAAGEADVPQLPQQPDGCDRAGGVLRAHRCLCARLRHPRRARQRVFGDQPTTATARLRSWRRPARRTWASRSSRCPRATT